MHRSSFCPVFCPLCFVSGLSSFYKDAGFPGGSDRKESAFNAGDLAREDPLEEEMATRSSILAWEIPWTEEPGGLQSMGFKKSRTRLSEQTVLTRAGEMLDSLFFSLN